MKLRHAMTVAVATAVIAPATFLAAPAAYATVPTPTESETVATAPTPTDTATTPPSPSDTDTSPGPPETPSSPAPSQTPTSPAPSTSTTAPDDEEPGEDDLPIPGVCETDELELSINGLPGKIAAGSGWHKFSLNVYNSSDATVSEIDYFAGASFDKDGENLFKTKQVVLQAFNEETNAWDDVNEGGTAAGYVGQSPELEPGYEVDIPLRINVKAGTPVGVGFTLGAGLYVGDEDCMGFSDIAYKFRIVAGGTDTGGTKPHEGGKAPVPSEKPASNTTSEVTGSLAETGSDSPLPVIGAVGGIAIVAGAGVVFAMKRRRSNAAA